MKNVCLYIDESGIGNPKAAQSQLYILSGCLVQEHAQHEMKVKADQIKYKYWDKTEVVFHSKEIARKEGEFKIFKTNSAEKDFHRNLFDFLHTAAFQMFMVVVDLKKARQLNWNDKKVYEETAKVIVKNFLLALLAQENVRGRLIIESATSQKDFSFHKAAVFHLSNGISEVGITAKQVQQVLTQISFVTKNNHDIEEQIADLMAYPAKLKFLKKKQADLNEYDKNILRILNRKLFKMHPDTGAKKKKFYEKIDSFRIIP